MTRLLDALIADSAERLLPQGPSSSGRELKREIEAQSQNLLSAGVVAGDAVAIALPDGPDMLTASLAAMSVAACAPLNPGLCDAEFEFCLSRMGVRTLIAQPDSPAVVTAQRLGIPVFSPGRPLSRPPATHSYPDAAVLMHTSATTGNPKLVPLGAAQILAMVDNTCRALELTPGDRFLSLTPLFHLQGLLSCLAQWQAGGGVVLTGGFDARMFLSWLDQYHPTWYTAGPALHRAILSLAGDSFRPDKLRLVRSIGAPLPSPLIAQLETRLGIPVIEGYGLTETGLLTSNPLQERKSGSVGRSLGAEIAISEGEVVVRGPAVFSGYVNDPEANRGVFRQGWFRTGDLGYIDDAGFLYITGRVKEMINRGGEKVLPLEVDTALSAHPAVEEAVTFGIPHATLGEDIAAAVVVRRGVSVSESELRRFVSTRLTAFKVPRHIVFLDHIPKSPLGKAVRSSFTQQWGAMAESAVPVDSLEERLTAIWAEILQLPEVGTSDNFFSLGGNSLLALQMLLRVEQEFDTSALALTEPPTIGHFAEILRNRESKAPACRHLFCIPAADENPFSFRLLAHHLEPRTSLYVLRNPEPVTQRGTYSVEHVAGLLLSSLRAVQPRGPYMLAGHCFGGIVAFEIARRLLQSGEQVQLLALIDTPRPGYPDFIREWRLYLRSLWRLDWIRRSDHPIRETLVGVRGLWRRIVSRTRKPAPSAFPGAADYGNIVAASRYVPVPYAGRIIQFAARDQWMTDLLLDSRLGWRDLARGRFEVQYIAGQHDCVLTEPCVSELAARLAGFLIEPSARVHSTL